jgi:shikimate kinase/GNAT superfamily N-acetyltransferase
MLVLLVGPSAVGKTTAGRLAVMRLAATCEEAMLLPYARFVDLEEEVLRHNGVFPAGRGDLRSETSRLLEQYGAEKFASDSLSILSNLQASTREGQLLVVAAGGEILPHTGEQGRLNQCRTVALVAPAEEAFARHSQDSGVAYADFYRANYSPEHLSQFAACDYRVDCSGLDADQSAARLADLLSAIYHVRLNLGIENTFPMARRVTPKQERELALMAVYRHAHGFERYYYANLPAVLHARLEEIPPAYALDEPEQVLASLREVYPRAEVFCAHTYVFSRSPDPEAYPDVVYRSKGYEVLVHGQTVSRAWSPDESETAAELAVETHPNYRRQGYARQAASAWAAANLAAGKMPFFSHRLGNQASQELARSMGVEHYAQVSGYFVPAAGDD